MSTPLVTRCDQAQRYALNRTSLLQSCCLLRDSCHVDDILKKPTVIKRSSLAMAKVKGVRAIMPGAEGTDPAAAFNAMPLGSAATASWILFLVSPFGHNPSVCGTLVRGSNSIWQQLSRTIRT